MMITQHAIEQMDKRHIPHNPTNIVAVIEDPRHSDGRELWLTQDAIVYTISSDHKKIITAYWEIPRRLLLFYGDCKAEKELLEETWDNARRNKREDRNWW